MMQEPLTVLRLEIVWTMLARWSVIVTENRELIPHKDMPPSTMTSVPVMKLDSSEHRNRTA